MGTNYYLRYTPCKTCKKYDELHIGKQSSGWKFLFRTGKDLDILSSYDWRLRIAFDVVAQKRAKIFDEYDKEISPKEFFENVEKNQGKKCHIEYYDSFRSSDFTDEFGYDCCWNEFC